MQILDTLQEDRLLTCFLVYFLELREQVGYTLAVENSNIDTFPKTLHCLTIHCAPKVRRKDDRITGITKSRVIEGEAFPKAATVSCRQMSTLNVLDFS